MRQAGVPPIDGATLDALSGRSGRLVAAVREVTLLLLAGTSTDEVLAKVAEHARELVGADLSTIAVPKGDNLELRVADGAFAEQLRGVEFPAGPSISGEVITRGATLLLDDVSSDGRAAQPVVQLGELGPTMFVPLWVRNEAFGTLLVSNRREGPGFDAQDQQLVETFAGQASIAFEFGQARDQLERLQMADERERVGRGLRENVIGRLSAVGMQVEGLAASLGERDTADSRRLLTGVVDELDAIITEIRATVFELRDP